MTPEANVQEKLTVTMAPPPAALAADKKKAQAKKRTEAENLIDGHAAGIKTDRQSEEEKGRTLASQGRKGGLFGFAFFGLVSFWTLTKYGRFLHADLVLEQGQTALVSAYHNLARTEWLFGLSSRLWAFRVFATLSPVFLVCALFLPRRFGRFWMGLGVFLGTIVTPIFLTVLFYVALTPWALLLRLFGTDPLGRSKHDGSYWIQREKPRALDHFEHMS
jgi:hypothetical protein